MQLIIKDEQNNVEYTYTESIWTGKKGLLVNGYPAKKTGKKSFEITTEEGIKKYEIRGSSLSDISIISDGRAVSTDHKWYEKLLIWLPFATVIVGAVLGGVLGAIIFGLFAGIATAINTEVMYAQKSVGFKVFVGLLVFAVTVAVAFLVDVFVVAAIFAAIG